MVVARSSTHVARSSTATPPGAREGANETGRGVDGGRGGRDIFVDTDSRNGCRDPLGSGRRRDRRGSSGGGGRSSTGIVVVVVVVHRRTTLNRMIQSFRLVSDPMLEKMSLLLATRPLGFENVHINITS